MFAQIRSFIAAAFRRRAFERDMETELQNHIDLFVEEQLAHGVSRAEAERRARVEFGASTLVKEQCRESRGLAWLDALERDSTYGFRMLRRSPVFAVVAILSLALGIGANTAIFSIINALILRPLPVHNPAQLVILNTASGADGLSFAAIREFERQSRTLSAVIASGGDRPVAIGYDRDVSAGVDYEVSANFFSTLGIQPALGRLFSTADDGPVAVLGYQYWQRQFHSDPNVLGKTIRIEGAKFIIIGVAGSKFVGTTAELPQDLSTLIGVLDLAIGHPDPRLRNVSFQAMGRLAPGASIAQARAELTTIWPAILAASIPPGIDAQQRAAYLGKRIDIHSGATGYSPLRLRLGAPLRVLMALSAAVLFIACVNLANLMLARAAARYREFAIRASIGAGPGTLIRQMLTESFLLSIAGAAAGFALGHWTSRILANFAWRGTVPLALDFSPDARILAFTASVAVSTAILIGILPAVRVARRDPVRALHAGLRSSGFRISRSARLLIVIQVALSLMLVTAAGLYARSLANLRNRDFGFSRDHLLTALKFPQPGRPAIDPITYWRQLESDLTARPEIAGAAMTNFNLTPAGDQRDVTTDSGAPAIRVDTGMITPGFFRTLGLPLRQGREFNLHDDPHAPIVAIMSQTLAGELFPSGDAIGRRINIGKAAHQRNLEVIGVVRDTLAGPRGTAPAATLYLAAFQHQAGLPWLIVRTYGDAPGAAAAIHAALNLAGQEYPFLVRTGKEFGVPVDEQIIAVLAGCFGSLALVLAAIGLYGVESYGVTERRVEIGIRLAVGETRSGVVALILGETARLVGLGLLLGAGLSLFVVKPADLSTLAISCAVLLLIGLSAGYLPARQAARLDPADILRTE